MSALVKKEKKEILSKPHFIRVYNPNCPLREAYHPEKNTVFRSVSSETGSFIVVQAPTRVPATTLLLGFWGTRGDHYITISYLARESMAREVDPATAQANRAAQAEEMEALHYIYGEDCTIHADEHFCEILVYPTDECSQPYVTVRLVVFFSHGYPSACEPTFEFVAPWLPERLRQKLVTGFHDIYLESCGEVLVFKWVEWMKEQAWLWEEAKRIASLQSQKETEADSKSEDTTPVLSSQQFEKRGEEHNLEELDKVLGIVHGSPFTEKRSTFQAHLAPVHSADQVETVMEALLRNRKIAGATHNIMAYRIAVSNKNTVLQDYDDDGETAAGGRLLHLLQIVDTIDVVVVVSRWFGGILLGPDRFKHINNAARTLLDSCGYVKDSTKRSSTSSSKKGKSSMMKS